MTDTTLNPAILSDWSPQRDGTGRFLPGHGGRPRNSKNKVSRDALAAVQGLSSLAIHHLQQRIEAGDMAAIRLTLEYTLPRHGRAIELDSDDPRAWTDALAHGEVSPAEAATAAQALSKLAEIADIQELRTRLDELEAVLTERQG